MITLQRQIDDNSCLLACIGMLAGIDHRAWAAKCPRRRAGAWAKLKYIEDVAAEYLPWLVPYFHLIAWQEIGYDIYEIPDYRRGILFTWDSRKGTQGIFASAAHAAVFADGNVFDPESDNVIPVAEYRRWFGVDTPLQATVTLTITDPHS